LRSIYTKFLSVVAKKIPIQNISIFCELVIILSELRKKEKGVYFWKHRVHVALQCTLLWTQAKSLALQETISPNNTSNNIKYH